MDVAFAFEQMLRGPPAGQRVMDEVDRRKRPGQRLARRIRPIGDRPDDDPFVLVATPPPERMRQRLSRFDPRWRHRTSMIADNPNLETGEFLPLD
jgi:hypothetical protein